MVEELLIFVVLVPFDFAQGLERKNGVERLVVACPVQWHGYFTGVLVLDPAIR
jgi:hypothetical protein